MIESPCLEGKKHYSPYKCTFVPESECINIIRMYPKLAKLIFFDRFKEWYSKGVSKQARMTGNPRGFHRELDKRYWQSIEVRKFEEIVQRRLNFAPNTFKAQHIYHRFGNIYRRFIRMNWHSNWQTNNIPTFSWDEYRLKLLMTKL